MIKDKIEEMMGRPNEKTIVQFLIKNPDSSRTAIKNALSTSMATITNATETLVANRIIKENGLQKNERGRSSISLDINKEKLKSIGVGITKTIISVRLLDLNGKVYGEAFSDMDFTSFENNVKNIVAGITDILEFNHEYEEDIIGIGLALPGFIEYNFKNLENTLVMEDWDTEYLVKTLEEKFKYGVAVSSAATAALSGEVYFGNGKNDRSIVYINVSSGGMAFARMRDHLIDKKVDKNVRAFGHTMINITNEMCSCGQCGCLEMYVNKKAIEGNYQKYLSSEQSLYLDEDREEKHVGYKEILDLGQKGDIAAIQALSKCATILGYALYNLKVLMHPDLIIIGGNLIDQSNLFYEMIVNTVKNRLEQTTDETCKFATRSLAPNHLESQERSASVASGAATVVFEKIFS